MVRYRANSSVSLCIREVLRMSSPKNDSRTVRVWVFQNVGLEFIVPFSLFCSGKEFHCV